MTSRLPIRDRGARTEHLGGTPGAARRALRLYSHTIGGTLLVRLVDPGMAASAAQLADALRMIPYGWRGVVIDLRGLVGIDNAAMSVLATFCGEMRKRGRRVCVAAVPDGADETVLVGTDIAPDPFEHADAALVWLATRP